MEVMAVTQEKATPEGPAERVAMPVQAVLWAVSVTAALRLLPGKLVQVAPPVLVLPGVKVVPGVPAGSVGSAEMVAPLEPVVTLLLKARQAMPVLAVSLVSVVRMALPVLMASLEALVPQASMANRACRAI